VKKEGDPLKLLNGFGALQLHQFPAIAGFHPADSEIGNQEANHVSIAKVGHEGGAVALAAIATDVTGGGKPFGLQAAGEGLKAHDQVLNQAAVLLSEALKHAKSGPE
jgi:hypothetical protein